MRKLPPEFYLQDTLSVAPALIGCYLVRQLEDQLIIGRINETEAYVGPIDKACHAYQYKLTARTKPLFAAGGIAYVYFIYGMYHCMNVVTEAAGIPCAVLIRSVELVQGLERAVCNRYKKKPQDISAIQYKNLTNGPGKLCQALEITRALNEASLQDEQLFICDRIHSWQKQAGPIATSKRIGISYAQEAQDFLWRFYEPHYP